MNELKTVNKMIVKPYSPNLGGIVTGIDLSKEISNSQLNFIKDNEGFSVAFQVIYMIVFKESNDIVCK